jgi:outer membrane receptor protein involved in Fe transport
MRESRLSVCCLALAAVVVPQVASAEQSAASAQTERRRADLEEVVVTAQKRTQTLSDVPIAVQAFGGDALEESHIRDFNEVVTAVPGASEGLSNTLGLRQYQIRGVSQSFGDPTVGYYFDDAAFFIFGQNFAPSGRTFDMNRVEVLRGPQSTLYGNGAMGGVVRFIPNAPDLQAMHVAARTGYSQTDGGEDGYYVDGALNAPLIDDVLGVRLVGSYERIGGYQDVVSSGDTNAAGGEIKTFRGAIRATPTDRLELKLLYLRNQTDQDGTTLLTNLDPPQAVNSPGDFTASHFDLFSGTVSYTFDAATLTSSSTYIDFSKAVQAGFPFPVPGGLLIQTQDVSADAFNNETRLVSNGTGPLQWLAGTYYADTKYQDKGALVPALLPDSTSLSKSESFSVFTEVSYALFDGKLTPLVGLRYFEDDRSSDNITNPVPPFSGKFDSINPRFNLTYRAQPGRLYYLNAAKGFRSGLFNNPTTCQILHRQQGGLPCEDDVDSDQLWSYELGTKQQFAGGQLQLETALYYQDWQDIQQSIQFGGVGQTYQFGDARLYGIDAGVIVTPDAVPGLRFEASGNWNSSEYQNIDPALTAAAAAGGIRDGDRIPLVPEWTASLTASYDWTMGSRGWEGLALVGYSHIDAQLGRPGAPSEGDARDLLRATIGVRHGALGISLFGSNLLHENGAIYIASNGAAAVYTQDYPRQIGIEITFDGR